MSERGPRGRRVPFRSATRAVGTAAFGVTAVSRVAVRLGVFGGVRGVRERERGREE